MINFLSVFPPYRGGIAKFSDSLYHTLNKTEDIKAYSFKKLYPDLLFPGTSQRNQQFRPNYALESLHSYNPFNWKTVAKQLFTTQTELFLFSYWHPFFAPAFSRILSYKQKNFPYIPALCIAHNIIPHETFPAGSHLMKRMFHKVDYIVVLSKQTEKELDEICPDCRQTLLFHPVYELPKPKQKVSELRKKFGFSVDDKIVLFFGLIRDYKGLDLLIKAMNEIDMKRRNMRILIAGEFYTNKNKYLDLIDPDKVDYYSLHDHFIPEQEMAELFTLSDLLVLPYRSASQSGVLANSIFFQLPALVSDHIGLAEHINHGETGLIFRSNDVIQLRNNILEYFDMKLKARISSNLSRLKDELSWDKFAKNLLKLTKSKK